jgi:rare lipoprotein A
LIDVNLRAKAKLVAMLVASPLVAAPPVWASSGGASPGGASAGAPPADASPGELGSTGGGASTTGSGTAAQNLVATASGDGMTVTTHVSALLGRHLAFTGTTTAADAGTTVLVQRLDPKAGWISVASGAVAAGGAFSILWRTNYAGRMTMRTVVEQTATTSQTGQTPPTLQITVFRPALATLYGRGFFGQRTACGQVLKRTTLGVASRTLRCGTPVQIYYRGRTIVVPVIDRGPYANNASWDLTQATAEALGITGTETIGAISA